jgi:hypothetical protein
VSRFKLYLATFILGLGIAWAYPVPTLSTKSLVSQADLIVAGKVERVEQIAEGSITLQSSTYRRRDFQATISVDETIKGGPSPSRLILNYSTPAMDSVGNVAEGGLPANAYRVVFLKKTPSGYAFASPYYPSLPASSKHCGPDWQLSLAEESYTKVLHRVLDVLCLRSSPEKKQLAIDILNWDEDSSAAPFLKAALNLPDVASDPVLRTAILSDLLKWHDLSVLPSAENDLFQSSEHVDAYLKSNLWLAISSLNAQVSVPLLARALTLPEPQARVGAARFLEYTNSDGALDALLSALDDPDRDVQFAVMQSLGNLTNQHEWRPQTTGVDALWFACIRHWQEFGALRHASKANP